jgi:hypothetical protein
VFSTCLRPFTDWFGVNKIIGWVYSLIVFFMGGMCAKVTKCEYGLVAVWVHSKLLQSHPHA